MPGVGRDVDVVPRQQLHHLVFELEAGGTGQEHNPLVLRLVVPEAFRGPMADAEDPLDADAGALLEDGGEFRGERVWEVGEEVHYRPGVDQPAVASMPPRAVGSEKALRRTVHGRFSLTVNHRGCE
jgi:hypothetical protein